MTDTTKQFPGQSRVEPLSEESDMDSDDELDEDDEDADDDDH